jgi:hypothetical protein
VSTEFRQHGIPRNFLTSEVISAKFRRNSAKFRGIPRNFAGIEPEITSVFRGMPKCHFRGHPMSSARIYRASFRENKPKTLVFNYWKRAFWVCFHENWVYKFGLKNIGKSLWLDKAIPEILEHWMVLCSSREIVSLNKIKNLLAFSSMSNFIKKRCRFSRKNYGGGWKIKSVIARSTIFFWAQSDHYLYNNVVTNVPVVSYCYNSLGTVKLTVTK